MKTLRLLSYLLVVALFSVSFVSCSDDDDDKDPDTELVGKWEFTKLEFWEEGKEGDVESEVRSGDYWTFNTDKSGYDSDEESDFTWSVKDDKLVQVYPGSIGTYTYTINSLNSKTLVVTYKDEEGYWRSTFKKV